MAKKKKMEPRSGDSLFSDLGGKKNNVTNINSKGGDIATEGSIIDKRSGGVYVNEEYRSRENLGRKKKAGKLVAALLVATFLGILSNIVAAYLQEKYSLISDTGRFIIVLAIFLVVLGLNVAIVSNDISE